MVHIFQLIFIIAVIAFLLWQHHCDNKSFDRLMEAKRFEAKNINNHRMTFHCMCDECVKLDKTNSTNENTTNNKEI